jgi:hypothetical protein
LYWAYQKFLKTEFFITAAVLTTILAGICLVKSTQQLDSVEINLTERYGGGSAILTQGATLPYSSVDKLLKESKALSKDTRSKFDVKFYADFDINSYINAFNDLFGPSIGDFEIPGFSCSEHILDEYVLEFHRGGEVVQRTWVVYGKYPNCGHYHPTNWKAYKDLENHLNRIFSDKSNKAINLPHIYREM